MPRISLIVKSFHFDHKITVIVILGKESWNNFWPILKIKAIILTQNCHNLAFEKDFLDLGHLKFRE